MAKLDENKISRLLRFEKYGNAATALSAAATLAFAILFSASQAYDMQTLKLLTICAFPLLIAVTTAAAAIILVKCNGELSREIAAFVRDTLIENARILHPEKSELCFRISFSGTLAEIKVNNFNETIKFDFSPFKKLTAARKNTLADAIIKRLIVTFCKLYEAGGKYVSVSYAFDTSKNKLVYILKNGDPDKQAFTEYLKAGNR